MPFFEVITLCRVHNKKVFLRVEAKGPQDAIKKATGMVVDCPWGAIDEPGTYIRSGHQFIVGFHGKEDILGVTSLPWMPQSIVSSAPSLTPIQEAPAIPLETLYYIDPDLQETQLLKSKWWIK